MSDRADNKPGWYKLFARNTNRGFRLHTWIRREKFRLRNGGVKPQSQQEKLRLQPKFRILRYKITTREFGSKMNLFASISPLLDLPILAIDQRLFSVIGRSDRREMPENPFHLPIQDSR